MKAFRIDNTDSFFGRELLFSRLMVYAKRSDSIQIIGSRRFGKTRLLKYCCTKILSDKSLNILPIFLDFSEVGEIIGRGNTEQYRYIVSVLINSMFENNELTKINNVLIKSIPIDLFDKWTNIYEYLKDANLSIFKIIDLLKDLIKNTDKEVLFLIDEYEYLLTTAFTSPKAFMTLRTMVQEPEYGLSVWIAGSVTWDELSESIGSGELNVCSEDEYLNCISRDSFSEMWQYECSLIENQDEKIKILSKEDFAYEQSGGIPYYAKILGHHLLDNTPCDYTILLSNFKEIVKNLRAKELEYLKEISKQGNLKYNGDTANYLITKGLIKRIGNGDDCVISIPLFKDYIYSLTTSDSEIVTTSKSIQETLVEHILENIQSINTNYNNKRHMLLLELSSQQETVRKTLQKRVESEEDYKVFSNTLYTYYYERVKNNSEPVIQNYKIQNSVFANIVDTNRHYYGGHDRDKFVPRPGKWTIVDLLQELNGNDREPLLPSEFQQMQLEILRRFDAEMQKLLRDVRNMR